MKKKSRLIDLALLFLKIGATGFGGPSALIAMMEIETVQKRRWVTHKHFMDMLAFTYLVPGPNAFEMASFLGFSYASYLGLLTAGICLIIPPTIITLIFAYYYQIYGSLPQAQVVFSSITPMIIAIILFSGYRIGKTALKNLQAIIIAIVCLTAALIGVDIIVVTLLAGVAGLFFYLVNQKKFFPIIIFSAPVIQLRTTLSLFNNRTFQLFLYFLRIGAILFGSGQVLFAYINYDIVSRFQWLTQRQLIDAIAVGQFTPGPVSSAVTFIGYLIEGFPGAIFSTIGIFLPSFFVVLLMGKTLPYLVKSPIVQNFFDGINAGVVALIFAVGLSLIHSSITNIEAVVFLLLGMLALIKYKIDPALLILSGVLIGFIKIIMKI